jgi:hypothetical protein
MSSISHTGRSAALAYIGCTRAAHTEKARSAALRHKAAIIDGGDPSGAVDKKRSENTIAELADRYVTEHVVAHNRPTTERQVRRIVETKIKPELGVVAAAASGGAKLLKLAVEGYGADEGIADKAVFRSEPLK